MKLFIEVELGPDEVIFATELLKTLRLLTDRVKTRDLKKLFFSLVASLKDDWDLERVASEIKVLTEIDSSDSVLDDFITAFEELVFSREMLMRQESLAPYMRLFPRLPERLKARIKDVFVSKVLKNLTLKRPIDASRAEMYPYVEAFAVLVNLEFVSVSGAVKTIISMLRKADNRCAAVTMLGKTLEICLTQLAEKCDVATLGELRASVQAVTEANFQYDISYIKESFGWNHAPTSLPSPPDHPVTAAFYGGAPKLQFQSGICALESFHGHRSTVFALTYDSRRDQIVSAGKDGSLISWSADGQIRNTVCLPRHYACSMDIHEASNSLLICGVAKDDAVSNLPPPCMFRYGATPSGWAEQDVYPKEMSKLISCIKAFRGTEAALVTGETGCSSASHFEEKVCYYQIYPDSSLKLLRTFSEHEDLITSLSLFPPNSNVFLSASRDCTIRVWDRRTEHSVGTFGTSKGGRVQAHASMVTSVDASDTDMIISAGMDSVINRWDFRNLSSKKPPVSSITLDESAILKVALKDGTAAAAVSTLNGLYYADFSQPRPFTRLAEPFVDGRRAGRYHDLKWSSNHNVMYAGGDDMRIDVYGIRLE